MQGDYGLWQCSGPCRQLTYDNEARVRKMLIATGFLAEKGSKYELTEPASWKIEIPAELIPYCPNCGKPMVMNLRADSHFVQDSGWYNAKNSYDEFIKRCENLHVLYLELGVGANTPVWIKYPFWNMTKNNSKAVYGCLNLGEAYVPNEISKQAICLDGDIADALSRLIEKDNSNF